jgi:copper chaperone CopZ
MKTITLKIKGMDCNSCAMLIKDSLLELKGIKDAEVKVGEAKITFDETKVDEKKIKETIREDGYQV